MKYSIGEKVIVSGEITEIIIKKKEGGGEDTLYMVRTIGEQYSRDILVNEDKLIPDLSKEDF